MSEHSLCDCKHEEIKQLSAVPQEDINTTKKVSATQLEDQIIPESEGCTDSNLLYGKSNKGSDYFYTEPESNLLKDIKKLFKTKKRKHFVKESEKSPENDCSIKVEAWEKHDKHKCTAEKEDYTFVGEILFPICSKEIFYQPPGVPIRNSQKNITLNDPLTFGKPILEKREYAYPERLIPMSGGEWTEKDQKDHEELMATANQTPSCKICNK